MPGQVFDPPRESTALKKRRLALKALAKRVRANLPFESARYFMSDANGVVVECFADFSGPNGAKRALDSSSLTSGAAIVRIDDGQELAFLRAYSTGVLSL